MTLKESKAPEDRLLRLPEIVGGRAAPGKLPISRSTWLRWVSSGYAPRPVRLGPKLTAWKKSEVEAFIARLPQ